ncbi:hypothetical protein SNE40_002954 [Patella caerulea]|uniref:PHD-type domain-containing protein n=1 Tax=Patella caerulea TaxID=87958 RepID=A0AAN8K9K4_PATCE
MIYLLILQSGDIEANPGPVKYPCGICNRNVAWNAKAIQCDGCDIWYHAKCADIGPDSYKALTNSSVSWICIHCGIPNLSSSHCTDLESFASANPFLPLKPDSYSKEHDKGASNSLNSIHFSSTPKRGNIRQDHALNVSHIMIETSSSHVGSSESEPSSSYLEGSQLASFTFTCIGKNSSNTSSHQVKDKLTILIINFQSVRNKRTELHNIISSCAPDIIIGSETHIDNDYHNAEFLPPNIPAEHKYQIFRKDRKELINKSGGGVTIMVRPDLPAEECSDLDTTCEIKWAKVRTSSNEAILIGAYYREPKSKIEALDELKKSLSKIQNDPSYRNMKIFLGGDFNLGDIEWEVGRPMVGARDKVHCDTPNELLLLAGTNQQSPNLSRSNP